MRGRRNSALVTLTGVTGVGPAAIAEALIEIRRRAAANDVDDAPESEIREIARRQDGVDPLAHYVEALREPAIEIDRRPRRATVRMASAPRNRTLPMIGRPLLPPPMPTTSTQSLILIGFALGAFVCAFALYALHY